MLDVQGTNSEKTVIPRIYKYLIAVLALSALVLVVPTAASRRSLGRVSVPVWLIILSDQLKIVALVSFYLTNKLILRGLILRR